MEVDQNADLTVPTILRYKPKGNDPELFADESIIQSGFKSEKSYYSEEEENYSKSKFDEEDSSSFLRKIMD